MPWGGATSSKGRTVRLTDLIVEQRDKQVFSHARPHLAGDEEVVHWARARHPEENRNGFVYLTTQKLLVVWSGGEDGHRALPLEDIDWWGVDGEAGGGPLLGVESTEKIVFVHMPVTSNGTAARVTSFLRRFARMAPPVARTASKNGYPGDFVADPFMRVTARRMSARTLSKRAVVTVAGVLLVLTGILITPIPGPWSFPIVLAGLAILASEYDWAKDVLDWTRHKAREARARIRSRRAAK